MKWFYWKDKILKLIMLMLIQILIWIQKADMNCMIKLLSINQTNNLDNIKRLLIFILSYGRTKTIERIRGNNVALESEQEAIDHNVNWVKPKINQSKSRVIDDEIHGCLYLWRWVPIMSQAKESSSQLKLSIQLASTEVWQLGKAKKYFEQYGASDIKQLCRLC